MEEQVFLKKINEIGLRKFQIYLLSLISTYYENKLDAICEKNYISTSQLSDSETIKEIETLILETFKKIDDREEFEFQFFWDDDNNLQLVVYYNSNQFSKNYKFGEYDSFYAVNCYNGYSDLISDLYNFSLEN